MSHVHIRGPLLSISGYGVHSRQIARWAFERDFVVTTDITPWGTTPWYTDRNECDGLVDKIMEASTPLISTPDYSFQIMLPHEWDNTIAKKNFGVSAIVETDICSEKWKNACIKMDHVIVPSEFAKKCLTTSGLKSKRVTVIPESYFDECKNDKVPLDLQFSTHNNYLMLGQMSGDFETDRKNTAQTIALFCKIFAHRSDVGLVVKTNSGSNSSVDREISRRLLKSIVDQVREGPFPKIYFLHGYLKDVEVASLYKHQKIKGFISLTHGEGFGLPLLEAAACGLPILATNWSAHTEFLNLGAWTKVPGRLENVPAKKIDNLIFVQGSKWAYPDMNLAANAISNFVTETQDVKVNNTELQNKILNIYSFDKIKKNYDKFFKRWK